MEDKNLVNKNRIVGKHLVRYLILIYWLLFWLLNGIDKIIGGAHFLFVGKDRFATIERFFDSIGLGSTIYANIALMITAALEIFAFVFFLGALIHFIKKNIPATRSWFFIGIALTLTVFTFFLIGDQIFGDHSELLEHDTYWLITILSWIIFVHVDKIQIFNDFSISKKQFYLATAFTIVLFAVTTFSIFYHNKTSFVERTQIVNAIKIDENKYKISFPFLAGSTAFENSITKFKKDNPNLSIDYVYTAPHPLRLGKSDGLIIYIQTKNKK